MTSQSQNEQRGEKTTTPMTSSGGNGNNTTNNANNTTTETQVPQFRFFTGEQGKRVRFYRNGDQFFKGLWCTISSYRSWEALLQNLNQHLCDSISLPQGVRVIFTVDGRIIKSLEELEHGKSYVTSSIERFKSIDYANAAQPIWSFVSTKISDSPYYSIRQTFQREENTDFVRPRIITIIRNGLKPRRVVRHLLNKRTAQSFEHVMQDITAIVKLDSGVVRKLYTINGKPVTCLADFFGQDHVFVAYGQMDKISNDDFYVVSDEYKRMNIGKPLKINGRFYMSPKNMKMPIRNDGFRKTMSPDPRSLLPQNVHIPESLRGKVSIIKLLGDGNTALVFKAAIRDPWNEDVVNTPSSSNSVDFPLPSVRYDALKIIRKETAAEMAENIQAEIDLMAQINHEFIVKLHDYLIVDESYYLRMELMEGGDLFEYLRQKRTLSEQDAASSIGCLSRALDYLHKNNIIHRDVKPENLLVFTCMRTGALMLKLADFGLAVRCVSDELLYKLCGTPTYVAPEVLTEFGYSYKADCWSAGVILYILHCGFPPFGVEQDEALFDNIVRGEFDFPSPSFDNVSNVAKLLIRRLIDTDSNARFSAEEILQSPWVQNLGQTSQELEIEAFGQLSELMDNLYEDNGFNGSEYFYYSRRASMDDLSERSISFNASFNSSGLSKGPVPRDSFEAVEEQCLREFGELPPKKREEEREERMEEMDALSRELSQSSFIYVSSSAAIQEKEKFITPSIPMISGTRKRNLPNGVMGSTEVSPSVFISGSSPRSTDRTIQQSHTTSSSSNKTTPRRPRQNVVTPRAPPAHGSPLRVRMK